MQPQKAKQEKVMNVSPFPAMEETVLDFWDKGRIFEKSVEREAPKGDYVFYDGPPFATGTPHYGHIVASLMKDVVPRFWTMNGYKVERKWGWDCHGLPIENIVEKEMGSKSKKDIETMGVAEFNERCRSKVLGYVDEWEKIVRRLGRWADMKNAYKTMDLPYMESIWWVFKELWDKDLVYEGYRSMHICPRCETTLSQQEVSEGYKDIKDLSAIAKFELVDEPGTYILAWTTTPWTLIGNVALAIGRDISYVLIENGEGLKYILAKERLEVIQGEYKVLKGFKGEELLGKAYRPLFDYYSKNKALENHANGWKIYHGEFVTTTDGTGIVHIAPAFGEDDMNLGKAENLPFVQHVNMDGTIRQEAGEFAGMNVKPSFAKAMEGKGQDVKIKPEEAHQQTDIAIIKYLAHNGLLFAKEKYEHSYPHCWRCDTPLINYATSSWFVAVTQVKDKAIEMAKDINWSPGHIKDGRFGMWLQGARDWSISRQRFWASVMPIWKCDCGEMKVFGSTKEINEKLGSFCIVRHGEAENNLSGIMSDKLNDGYSLTAEGKAVIAKVAEKLSSEKIDLIFASDLDRTKETAGIIAKATGAEVIFDERLRETYVGDFHGKKLSDVAEFRAQWCRGEDICHPNGDSWNSLRERVVSFYNEIFSKHRDKNILVVSHGDAITALEAALSGENYLKQIGKIHEESYIHKGELRKLQYKLIDLHKHVVDTVSFKCEKCGNEMHRVPDVLDTWFDSGSMPYAQMHYPFENKEKFERNFPAEFIAEGIDQTRAWFYYLHVIGTAIKDRPAFKNVIVNGIVLAEDGKKMSKKLQNYPDPALMFDKYGADAMRSYLLASSVVAAENLNFAESGVQEVLRNNIMTLWNVYKFYELFAEGKVYGMKAPATENVLDKWILAKLNQLIAEVTDNMKKYDLPRSVRPIGDFINDLSTWYLRRSRDRFKSENEKDKLAALETTGFVLSELAKVMAPFTPFITEQLWQKVSGNDFKDENKSVHLESWPKAGKVDELILKEMEMVRKIVELGLAKRDEAGIKVRQPLNELRITNYELRNEYSNVVKDELNVKNITSAKGSGEISVELDTEITPELKLEGVKREIVRFVNAMRKDAGMSLGDKAIIFYDTPERDSIAKEAFDKFAADIMNDTLSEAIKAGTETAEIKKEVKIEGESVQLGISKK